MLRAFGEVPRHRFLPEGLREFAYEDAPLPIARGRRSPSPTSWPGWSQAAGARAGERGARGRHGLRLRGRRASASRGGVHDRAPRGAAPRARASGSRELGYHNVQVLPWRRHAGLAGARALRRDRRRRRRTGGAGRRCWSSSPRAARLVIPVGPAAARRTLVRVRRTERGTLRARGARRDVRFVAAGRRSKAGRRPRHRGRPMPAESVALVARGAEPLERHRVRRSSTPLLERIGDARVVLLGEATHGTAEFYRMRARITRELIGRHGFGIVAVEADWPDAARIDRYVRHLAPAAAPWQPFARFPTWMWRNERGPALRPSGCARTTRRVEAASARRASTASTCTASTPRSTPCSATSTRSTPRPRAWPAARYGCLTPWQTDPAAYGARRADRAAIGACEAEVVAMLGDLLEQRLEYARARRRALLDAVQNARVVANAERLLPGDVLRVDVDVLEPARPAHVRHARALLGVPRPGEPKVVVWAHNSHVGDATATEMGARGRAQRRPAVPGERSAIDAVPGRLRHRPRHGGRGVRLGRAPWRSSTCGPAHRGATSALCHEAAHRRASSWPSASRAARSCATSSTAPRLERAIGVIYRPETELQSHYFQRQPAPAVRRVDLVRPDDGPAAAGRWTDRSRVAGDVPFRALRALTRQGATDGHRRQYGYTRTLPGVGYDEAVGRVTDALRKGFGVLTRST